MALGRRWRCRVPFTLLENFQLLGHDSWHDTLASSLYHLVGCNGLGYIASNDFSVRFCGISGEVLVLCHSQCLGCAYFFSEITRYQRKIESNIDLGLFVGGSSSSLFRRAQGKLYVVRRYPLLLVFLWIIGRPSTGCHVVCFATARSHVSKSYRPALMTRTDHPARRHRLEDLVTVC